MLSCNELNRSDQLLHIFICYVDVGCHHYALLGALFNVDAHGVEDVGEFVACNTANFYDGFGRIRFETSFEGSNGHCRQF
jgi:hypothetical protein